MLKTASHFCCPIQHALSRSGCKCIERRWLSVQSRKWIELFTFTMSANTSPARSDVRDRCVFQHHTTLLWLIERTLYCHVPATSFHHPSNNQNPAQLSCPFYHYPPPNPTARTVQTPQPSADQRSHPHGAQTTIIISAHRVNTTTNTTTMAQIAVSIHHHQVPLRVAWSPNHQQRH